MEKPKKKVSYDACHRRVREIRGTASKCETCGVLGAKRYEWASITKNYEDINDYKQLCTRCHRKMDGFDTRQFLRINPKPCVRCGKKFTPRAGQQIMCGDRAKKKGCTYKHFNEYHLKRYHEKKKLKGQI